jgi:prolycopene isomerase
MKFRGESRRDVYDVIVVGSGIGGLTAAALLARAGRSVLVVERHDRVGGYAHAFRRGRYLFDSAVHLVGGCEPVGIPGGGLIHSLLTTLGVRERCDFARIDPCYAAVYPGTVVRAPGSVEEFVQVHAGEDRAEAKALRQFLQECLDIREETRRASQLPSPFGAVTDARRFPTLLRYRRATLAQVLDAQLESHELKALVGTLWPYLGLPPSRVSFLYFANMLMSYLTDGAFYCRGSFQRFADALAAAIVQNGGEILLRSSVRRIRVENGRACGVVLEHGQRIEAPLVLSNADARQTVEELVGPESFPTRYVTSLRRMKPSLSSFIVHAAASLPLSARETCHETFLYSSFDHDQAYRSSLAGNPSWLSVTVPTLADPSLAPAGQHLLILTTLIPYGSESRWRTGKDRLAGRLLEMAERQFPGLGASLEFVESGTPRTLERYTRNTDGALYGWELSPAQVGSGRLSGSTPIAGLRLVGHWTQPGGGVYGVVSSGIVTARGVLGPGAELDLA